MFKFIEFLILLIMGLLVAGQDTPDTTVTTPVLPIQLQQCSGERQICGGYIGFECCTGQGLTCITNAVGVNARNTLGFCMTMGPLGQCGAENSICGDVVRTNCCNGLKCRNFDQANFGKCINETATLGANRRPTLHVAPKTAWPTITQLN
ncbi:unnamed protein product [Oppiella nova]|uniref:Uncharacterized protein n=1 Tax=Oppiella nova TaxID=334625 RepID=A0A7R9LQ28_9ACAR|nr:unnamed protein product [Oppiella nova]CAG2165227.1 unnamed protein product [Oppiella nova]